MFHLTSLDAWYDVHHTMKWLRRCDENLQHTYLARWRSMCRKRLSTNDDQNNEFLETLKSNYKQRIEEVDAFSRNLSNSSADFRSQYLIGLSDMLQHYLDLQKKFTKDYPLWYDADLMGRQSGMITESLVNTIRNMNSFYSSSLDYWTKNMRVFNQGMMKVM